MDFNQTYVLLNKENEFVDLRGKTPGPGYYTFILHYYQPFYPGECQYSYSLFVINQEALLYEQYDHDSYVPQNSSWMSSSRMVSSMKQRFHLSTVHQYQDVVQWWTKWTETSSSIWLKTSWSHSRFVVFHEMFFFNNFSIYCLFRRIQEIKACICFTFWLFLRISIPRKT